MSEIKSIGPEDVRKQIDIQIDNFLNCIKATEALVAKNNPQEIVPPEVQALLDGTNPPKASVRKHLEVL